MLYAVSVLLMLWGTSLFTKGICPILVNLVWDFPEIFFFKPFSIYTFVCFVNFFYQRFRLGRLHVLLFHCRHISAHLLFSVSSCPSVNNYRCYYQSLITPKMQFKMAVKATTYLLYSASAAPQKITGEGK